MGLSVHRKGGERKTERNPQINRQAHEKIWPYPNLTDAEDRECVWMLDVSGAEEG